MYTGDIISMSMSVSDVLMMISAWVNPESKFINNEPMLQYSDSAVLINIQFPIFDTDEKKKSVKSTKVLF